MMTCYMVRARYLSIAAALVLLAGFQGAVADPLPKPEGKVILTISGFIEHTNSPEGAQFDYEMLAELGLVEMTIQNDWTEPGARFEGVLMRTLLDRVGASGDWVRATAANDYSANIPFSDLTDFDTLLGLSQNGQRMRLRDKGPAWILYSNDDRPDATTSELNQRMVWQLSSLTVL